MKTTIATVVLVSSLFSGQVLAQESQPKDVLESSLARSIQHDVTAVQQQVKNDNSLDLLQLITDFKFALSPSTIVSSIAETASELLSQPEE